MRARPFRAFPWLCLAGLVGCRGAGFVNNNPPAADAAGPTSDVAAPTDDTAPGEDAAPQDVPVSPPADATDFEDGPGPDGACAPGTTRCAAGCVDLATSPRDCGSCGNACTAGARCTDGTCVPPCASGFELCNGVCTDLRNDPLHCGTCTAACGVGQSCVSGTCRTGCAWPNMLCGSQCVSLLTDRANCGTCAHACATMEQCNLGTCTLACGTGLTACSGRCVDMRTDAANCGSCGHACAGGQTCTAGTCTAVCSAPLTTCGTACVDLQTSVSHCGACGTRCSAGQTCLAGRCTDPCNSDWTRCDGSCVSVLNDANHCGACGLACATGQVCLDGACAAPLTTVTRYEMAQSALARRNDACVITPASDIFSSGTSEIAGASLSFPFRLFNDTRSYATADVNGALNFTGNLHSPTGVCPSDPTSPPRTVFAWWTDLRRAGGSRVCSTTIGAPGGRRTITTWSNIYYGTYAVSALVSFSVVLYEGSNVIDVEYGSLTVPPAQDGGVRPQHAIGLHGATSSETATWACGMFNAPQSVANTRIRFTPRAL